MKLTLNIFEKGDDDVKKRRPLSHLFGGRVRTSTLVLIVVFLAVWWTYDTYKPQPSADDVWAYSVGDITVLANLSDQRISVPHPADQILLASYPAPPSAESGVLEPWQGFIARR